MRNSEIVEEFIKTRKKQFTKFAIIQALLDIVEIAVAVYIILNIEKYEIDPLFLIIPFFIVFSLIIFMNIKVCFGSFKKFSYYGQINGDYYNAKQALAKVQKASTKGKATDTELSAAQKKFDETIDEIAEKIKADFSE